MEQQAEVKKLYFMKLQANHFQRKEVRILERMPNGALYSLFYLKLCLESLADNGYLRLTDEIPYNAEMLGGMTNMNVDIVRGALQACEALGLIQILEDATIYVKEVEAITGQIADNPNAERQRRFKARKKAEKANLQSQEIGKIGSVTKSNAEVTQSVTENNEEYRYIDSRDNIKERKKKKERKEPAVTPEGSLIIPPTLEEVKSFVIDRGSSVNAVRFYNYYRARNWIVNGVTIVDWRALLIAWEENQRNYARTPEPPPKEYEYLQNDYSQDEIEALVRDPLADLAQIMEGAT